MSTISELHRHFQQADTKAQRVFEVIRGGGIAIFPVYAGYGVFGATDSALDRIYAAKQRAPHKLFTLVGNRDLHRQAHLITASDAAFVDRVTNGLDLALGVVAELRLNDSMIAKISPGAMARSARDGRVNILLNAGAIMNEVAALSQAERLPVFGTSANLSGFGLKGRVQEIEAPVTAAADLIIDEGPLPGYSSTIVDFTSRTTVRFGHRYADVRAIAKAEFGLKLPAEPSATPAAVSN